MPSASSFPEALPADARSRILQAAERLIAEGGIDALTTRAVAAAAGLAVLRERVRRVARTGRLLVSESRAVSLIHAAGTGTVAVLLAAPAAERGRGLADAAWNAVFKAIIGDAEREDRPSPSAAAVSLGAQMEEVTALTPGERLLLRELLDRIANQSDGKG